MRIALFLIPLLPLAACAQAVEDRVATRLAEAGLPRGIADCMAERWVDRLSVNQIRKIGGLADNFREQGGKLTIGGFVGAVRDLDDPEIVEVVTRSSVACALR